MRRLLKLLWAEIQCEFWCLFHLQCSVRFWNRKGRKVIIIAGKGTLRSFDIRKVFWDEENRIETMLGKNGK